MTSRAIFGEFARAAHRHLDSLPTPALQSAWAVKRGGDAGRAAASVRAVLRPMTGYVADVAAVFDAMPPARRGSLAPWARAASRAAEALANAAAYLQPVPGNDQPGQSRPQTRTAAALQAAAVCMTAGRDLLHTHAVSQDDGAVRSRSQWAPVIVSVPVCRALLHEVARWAGKVAPQGGQAAITGMTGTTEQRRALNGACQWLWVLQWAVEAASEQQPLAARDLALLHAIPANAPVPRHLPSGSEPVTALCHGIIGAAERARAAAYGAADRATWSQDIARESMRHIAAHCTVTSWNCHLLLRALAAGHNNPADLAAELLGGAADAADSARAAWLQASQAWDVVVTDAHGGLSPAAVAAEDLAVWTGRLAYADPKWTPALGHSGTARRHLDLTRDPGDLRRVVAAMHHACHAAGRLAATGHEQLQIAATSRRLIVPARNLPRSFGIPYQFAPAPPESASSLLDAYQLAGDNSDRAAAAIAAIAEAVRAPSRVLTTAQAAGGNDWHDQQRVAGPAAWLLRQPAPPGPAERVLLDLGVTSHSDLRLAASLDHATSQLLLRAASTADPTPDRRGQNIISSAGTAELINHLFATGHGGTVLDAMDRASGTRPQGRRTSRVLVRADLPATPLAPRQARQHLRQALAEQCLSTLADTAELLASELVTNAAKHAAGNKIGLVVRETTAPDGKTAIRCEVSDRSATLPQQRPGEPGAETGRALAIIAALAADSGVRAGLNGKTCWFTLTAPDPAPSPARQAEPEAEAGA